jgi:tetratricopeptide (TPR) repeat protein
MIQAYYNLANALYQQGKLEEAIQNYKKAIEINPKLD